MGTLQGRWSLLMGYGLWRRVMGRYPVRITKLQKFRVYRLYPGKPTLVYCRQLVHIRFDRGGELKLRQKCSLRGSNVC